MGGKQLGKIQSLSGFLDRGVGKGYSRFLVKIRKKKRRDFVVKVYWRNQNLKGS